MGNDVNISFTGDSSKLSKEAQSASSSLDKVKDSAKAAGEEGSESLGLLGSVLEELRDLTSSIGSAFKSMWQDLGAGIKQGVDTGASRIKEFVGGVFKHFITLTEQIIAVRLAMVFWGSTAAFVLGMIFNAVTVLTIAYKTLSFVIGLVTGESYKSKNIDALIAENNAVKELQKSLQLSAVDASAMHDALQRLGVNKADIEAVYNGVKAALRGNHEELERLGVAYKDVNGNILDNETIVRNAKAVLEQYTDGWDRNQAAAALGMGSYEQINNYLRVNQQELQKSKQRLDEFNLGIGPESQAAITAYQTAMLEFRNEARLMGQGFSRAIADNIMPALTGLANFFKESWPSVVRLFRYTMAEVTTLLWGIKMTVDLVVDGIKAGFGSASDILIGVAKAVGRALTGDFSGAKDALVEGWDNAKTRIGKSLAEIVADAKRNAAAMKLAWGFDDRSGSPDKPRKGKDWTPAPEKEKETGEQTVRDNAAMWLSAHAKYLEYLRAFTALEIEEIKSGVAEELELNQEAYDLGLISLKQFLTNKQELTETAIKAEMDAKKKELALYTAEVDKERDFSDPKEANAYHDALLKQATVEKELVTLETQLTDSRLKTAAAVQLAYGDLTDGMKKGFNQYVDQARQYFKIGEDLARQTAGAMQSAMADGFFDLMQAKFNTLGKVIQNFLMNIQRMIANFFAQQATNALINSLGSAMGFGLGANSQTPSASSSTAGYRSTGWNNTGAATVTLHDGGLVPRFHFGGLASDEVPAILQTGERVLDREHNALLERFANKANDAVNVQINIENKTGSQVTATQGDFKFDGKAYIQNIVLELYRSSPAFRNGISSGGY